MVKCPKCGSDDIWETVGESEVPLECQMCGAKFDLWDVRVKPEPCLQCNSTGGAVDLDEFYCSCLWGQYAAWDECGDTMPVLFREVQERARSCGQPVFEVPSGA